MSHPRGRPRTAAKPNNPVQESTDEGILHTNLLMIEVTEPWLLDTLLKDTLASRMIFLRIDEHSALVVPGQYENLLARLRKLGYTPRTLER